MSYGFLFLLLLLDVTHGLLCSMYTVILFVFFFLLTLFLYRILFLAVITFNEDACFVFMRYTSCQESFVNNGLIHGKSTLQKSPQTCRISDLILS